MSMAILVRGLLLGVGAAAPIGPVNVEIARRTLRLGMPAGVLLGCGAVTVDVAYAIISSFGAAQAARQPTVQMVLGLGGGAFLAWIGIGSLIAAARQARLDVDVPPTARGNPYLVGLMMTLLNPMTLVFWFLSVPAAAGPVGKGLPWMCAGVFVATLSWVLLFSGVLRILQRLGRSAGRWLPIMADAVGGATLLGFAIKTIWRSSQAHL